MKRDNWLTLFFFALLMTGVLTQTAPLTFLALAVGLILLAGRMWAREAAKHMRYQHAAVPRRCMTGDELQLQMQLDNPTFLPLPWIELTDMVQGDGFELTGTPSPHRRHQDRLIIRTGLSWFQRIRRSYTARVHARGYYPVGPTAIRIWDPLGLTFSELRVPSQESILVYPVTVPLEDLGISADDPFGDPEQQRWLFRDPFSVAGARPYEPGDPMRHIHWPSTAARGELMTRQMEGIRSPEMLIFLNLRTMERAWQGAVLEYLELSLCAAASVARHGTRRGYRIGLYSNGNLRKEDMEGSAPRLQVEPSSDPRQLRRILSMLAQSAPHASRPLHHTLRRRISGESYGASLVVISALMPDDLRNEIHRLAREGHAVTLLYTGDPPGPSIPGVPCHTLGGKRRWQEIAEQWNLTTE